MRPPSLKAADFQRALGSRPVSRTTHFTLHALPRLPQASGRVLPARAAVMATAEAQPEVALKPRLSTTGGAAEGMLVDDFVAKPTFHAFGGPSASECGWQLGLVLPKKQARRSVTRSLIRHQAREALRRHAPAVQATRRYPFEHVAGWVVRLRAPFDRKLFPSAASDALKTAVRQELDELWARLASPAIAGNQSRPETSSPPQSQARGAA